MTAELPRSELPLRHEIPELLAPAGNRRCAEAAIACGADAIYFGLETGFNARYRADNFHLDDLDELMSLLRTHDVRGYVTLNTLIFTSELKRVASAIQRIAAAGVDAVLVQDLGVARLVRDVCPDLAVHASTQMSLTSVETIAVAGRLGLSRVVLARELSVPEIRKITASSTIETEVFIHGALCVAYSGQCLTSESLGGRSANRGQCAQACRLPYDVVADGRPVELEEQRYLLSPQDLAGYEVVADLADAGVASLKIEGRLKSPEYVANITSAYRQAIDRWADAQPHGIDSERQREMELSFSRGFSPGWLRGNDHKRLVPGLSSAKRGVSLGKVSEVLRRGFTLRLEGPLRLGDGIAVYTAAEKRSADPPDNETDRCGGRIYGLKSSSEGPIEEASVGDRVEVDLGRSFDPSRIAPGDPVFLNDDPRLNRKLRQAFSSGGPLRTRGIRVHVRAVVGDPLRIAFRCGSHEVAVASDQPLALATKRPATEAMIRQKLDAFGGTPFQVDAWRCELEGEPMVPVSIIKNLRREAVIRLQSRLSEAPSRCIEVDALDRHWRSADAYPRYGQTAKDPPVLVVLCRTLDQLRTTVEHSQTSRFDSGDGETRSVEVAADFHDVRRYGEAVRMARSAGVPITVASVRMHKPGEVGYLNVLRREPPDRLLCRNLAALQFAVSEGWPADADFSLNVTNPISMRVLQDWGADRITPSYDLNGDQIGELIDHVTADRLQIVVHQHMPMFHMEHCVFCSVLSPGTNKTNCGRPCDRHAVELVDRVGEAHVLEADVACRNTLYNAKPQSAAELIPDMLKRDVGCFRIELLRETVDQTRRTIGLYQRLLGEQISPRDVWTSLSAMNRVGVTRGTLETRRHPLAIV